MTPEALGTVAEVAVLLLFSAFFSGSETALTAVSRPRIHTRVEKGDRLAMRVQRLLDRRERTIGAILLGNNLVNILASALATRTFVQTFGNAGVLYATAMMTMLILLFAEILPKTLAIRHADRAAPWLAIPIEPLVTLLTPLSAGVGALFRIGGRIGGRAGTGRIAEVTEELRGAIELAAVAGVGKEHRDMLRSVLDLERVTVGEIMVHRSSMTTLDADADLLEILGQVAASPYTRFPVWRKGRENIIGVLHEKALLNSLREKGRRGTPGIAELLEQAWYVPETISLARQLEAFRARTQRLALVVDEYGEVQGLIALEDIVEEVVGEIPSEFDRKSIALPQADGSVIVPGSSTLRDLNRRFDWDLPDDEASTLAGLAIETAERIPEVGDSVDVSSFRLSVVARRRANLTRIRITRIEEE